MGPGADAAADIQQSRLSLMLFSGFDFLFEVRASLASSGGGAPCGWTEDLGGSLKHLSGLKVFCWANAFILGRRDNDYDCQCMKPRTRGWAHAWLCAVCDQEATSKTPSSWPAVCQVDS